MPIEITSSEGYLITVFEDDAGITVHLLAEDYDTDIDHELDEMRFHRSRVNYVNKVEPIGVSRTVRLRATVAPTVYTPFREAETEIRRDGDETVLTLPEGTAYAILHFGKRG